MASRDEYVAKLAQKLSDETRRSVQKQIEEGKSKVATARQKLDMLKSIGSDKYEEAKATLESFWKEAKAVFEKR